ncbi:hypothetical protein TcasGA2_TC014304 [Tribolium castaneum]|uniref:Uncharacterized protein n=1 Tax=Tribolium castaneum TaxID=7070 RepID=D6WL67_TRICA|nr:hypothetical protein TcasGA2_TC014304 [Tribolium castaneum]
MILVVDPPNGSPTTEKSPMSVKNKKVLIRDMKNLRRTINIRSHAPSPPRQSSRIRGAKNRIIAF